MIKHIFTIGIEYNLNKEENQIIATNTQQRGNNQNGGYLITNHINPNINTYNNNIKDKHSRPYLK